MSTNFQLQAVANKLINQSTRLIDQLNNDNEFFTQTIMKLQEAIRDEEIIKQIYGDQKHYVKNIRQYLEDIKLMASTLKKANEADFSDYIKLKNILEMRKLPSKELMRLQRQVLTSQAAASDAIERYRYLYEDAVERVPFLDLNGKATPFS